MVDYQSEHPPKSMSPVLNILNKCIQAISSSSDGSKESDASVNAKRSHKHKHKIRKKTLVPKPFGTAGKKGNGERGSCMGTIN